MSLDRTKHSAFSQFIIQKKQINITFANIRDWTHQSVDNGKDGNKQIPTYLQQPVL